MRRLLALALLAASVASAQVSKVRICDSTGSVCSNPDVRTGDVGVALPPASRAGFGAVLVTQETPVVALSFNYSINSVFVTTTSANGGSVTQSNSKAVLQTSTNTAGSALLESRDAVRYTPGQGVTVRFTTVFSPCVAGSQQEIGIGDVTDGFFVGCQGATFGFFRRQNGVDFFTPQTAWNGRTLAPALDITKGQVWQIRYQWLGFGAIRLFQEDPASGNYVVAHTILYANTATNPSVFNPTLPLHARAFNSGNGTNVTLQTASMGVYVEGPPSTAGSNGSAGNSKTPVSETAIISIQNKTTFQGKTNRARVELTLLNAETAADATIRVLLNTTLGGTPSFTDFDTATSVVAFDTAGTTVTGGRQFLRLISPKATLTLLLTDTLHIILNPGDVLTFTVDSGATTVNVAWVELFGG